MREADKEVLLYVAKKKCDRHFHPDYVIGGFLSCMEDTAAEFATIHVNYSSMLRRDIMKVAKDPWSVSRLLVRCTKEDGVADEFSGKRR